MSHCVPVELMKDLLRLRKEYGDQAFIDLLAWIRDPVKREALEGALEEALSSPVPSRSRKSDKKKADKRPPGEQVLEGMADSDPKRAERLRAARDSLVAKRVLPTVRELRAFADDIGLKPPKAGARKPLIAFLVRELADMDPTAMNRHLSQLGSKPGDRTLEGWSDVILNKRRPES